MQEIEENMKVEGSPSNNIDKILDQKATIVRREIVKMSKGKNLHFGGSLSIVEILVVLYFYIMRHDPKNPNWEQRDRFVLSKGHAVPALYAVLAEAGYFPVSQLSSFRELHSILQGHPHLKTPGIEASTGSLGQGLSVGSGMALGAKLNKKDYYIYVLIGDGEANEGPIWEAALFCSSYKLNNLIVIMDRNHFSAAGPMEERVDINPVADKWRAFNWNVLQVNGHSVKELIPAIEEAKKSKERPSIIIAQTVKGKGVSFIENKTEWHNNKLSEEQYKLALSELSSIQEETDR